jgi:HEAT repeat protein
MNCPAFHSLFAAARAILLAAVLSLLLGQHCRAQGLEDAPYRPTPEVVKGAIGALRDPYEEVVLAAIQNLSEWQAAEATGEMQKLLTADTSLAVRAEAFQFFVALGAKARPFLPALATYLSDAQPGVRERAINAIAAAGAAAAYQEAVLPLLADPRKEVRVAAAICLGRAGEAARGHRDVLTKALVRAGSPEFKTALLDALMQLGDLRPADAASIVPFLSDRSSEVRIAAAAAIFSAILDAKAAGVPADFSTARAKALERFRQEPPEVRGAILKHTITDPETAKVALDAIIEELSERPVEPRRAALFALGLAGQAALPQLPAILAQYKSPELRAAVLSALRGIGPKAVETNVDLVFWALLDSSEDVRSEALLALPLCGDALKNRPYKVVDIFGTASPEIRDTLLKAGAIIIQTLGADEESMPGLHKALTDPSADFRIAGCFVAGQLGNKGAAVVLPAVITLLSDADAAVRGAAAIALRSYVDQPEAREKIRGALRPLLKDDDDQVRWAALDTLTEADPGPDAALVDQIAALLNDPDRSVRNAAVRALGAAGPAAKRHFAAILGMFTDDPDVPPYAASRTVIQLSPLSVPELTSLLQPLFLSRDVLSIVRLTAHEAAGGRQEGELLLRLLGKTGRPTAEVIKKEEVADALAVLTDALTAPSLNANLREEIAVRIAELRSLGGH